jgi:hypothetical protein
LSIAGTEPDDDGVQASHQLDGGQLDEIMERVATKLEQCKTEAELHKWRKEHEQGLSVLDRTRLDELKKAWTARLNSLKPAMKKGKTNE